MYLLGRLLLVLLTMSTSARCWQLTPNDPYPTLVPKLELTPAMIEEMGGFAYVQAALANATLPGKSRSPRQRRSEHGLEARQTTNNETCSNPNFVLTCPITEQDPCCDPAYPICCHDPSNTCCPTGTFCQGLQTCCLNGAVGCGEGCCQSGVPCCNNTCCPSSSYICDTSTGGGTCVNTATTGGPSQASTQGQETASHDSAALPTNTATSKKSNNTAIIGGAVGGGVVALILIALLAWWILRRNPSQPSPVNNLNGTNAGKPGPANSVAPSNNYSNAPLMSSTPSAYNHSNGTPLSFATHTQPTTSSPPPGTINTTSAGRPFSVPSFVVPTGGGPGPGMGMAAGVGGLVAGGMAAEAMHDRPGSGQGGLNYVPPPAENNPAGANYYANTPAPHLGGGGGGYGGPGSTSYGGNASTYAPSTVMSPSSPHMSTTSGAPLMPISAVGVSDDRPPWMTGPSPSQSPAPSHGAPASSYTPAPTSYTPPPASTYSPPPPGAAPANFGMNQATHLGLMSPPPGVMTPPPGVMSPPPPFSPAPGGGLGDAPGAGESRPGYTPWASNTGGGGPPPPGEFGGAGGSDGMGRTVPMTAPADSKATFSGAGGYH